MLAVESVTTARVPLSDMAQRKMLFSSVLVYRFWVRLSTRSSLPERL